MGINVNKINPKYDFIVGDASYIGQPRPQTVMFVTCKVKHLIANLVGLDNCLVFAEKGMEVPEEILQKNCFVFSDCPQLDYAEFVSELVKVKLEKDKKRKYILTDGGYYLGENVIFGKNVYIEPGCVIGHDVVIGNNAHIYAGVVLKNARIGDNVVINEHAVIGAAGFTMVEDKNGNKKRIPTLGKVIIGNNVEIGALDNISCGSGGDTVIEDFVKIDAMVHIGHDAYLHKNAEITAGGIVGGFVEMQEKAYLGINAIVRNRITLGENSIIGMGAVVTKSVADNTTVVGNPARTFVK